MKKKLFTVLLVSIMILGNTVSTYAAETTQKGVDLSLDVAEEYEVPIPEAATITNTVNESNAIELSVDCPVEVSGNLYETTQINVTAPESITLTDSIVGSDREIVMDVTAPDNVFTSADALASTTRTWNASTTAFIKSW